MSVRFDPFQGLVRRLGLEPEEGRRLLLMGTLVGVLLCAYTIAKVLRDALFLARFGALRLPYAYLAVAVASAGFVWIESRVARRFPDRGATRFNQYLAIACSVAAALLYPVNHTWTSAVFYVWTGSQAMMLLPHFWLLALEVWDSRRARRVFPVLAGCGLIGGLAGGAFAGWTNPVVQRIGLMWTLPPLLFLAHVLTRAIEANRTRREPAAVVTSRVSPWKIMRRSPYIRVFVVGLALSVIVGTLVDFQFKSYLRDLYPSPAALTQYLGRFYVVLNALSLVFQFGIAGWLLQRFGLGFSTGLQPASVLALAAWLVISPGVWVVVALRWIQGVLSQTLGKSTNEIYYTAIRPGERRRVKPAIDTLVERWSDAAVGVLLIVVLHVLRVPIVAIAVLTAILAALWIGVLFALDRRYGGAFGQMLSSRWGEPEDPPEAMRTPAARRALFEALHAADEPGIVLALRLSGEVKNAGIIRAVRECLGHASPVVRASAVGAMETLGLADHENRIAGFLDEPHEALRGAAVRYLLVRGPRPLEFARRVLEGNDEMLQRQALDVLFDFPCEARAALTAEWLDARIRSTRVEDHRLAARGAGVLASKSPERLRLLLANPDTEVRRIALRSAIRRPSRALIDVLLPLLLAPDLAEEARRAVSALGDAAMPGLEALLAGGQGTIAQSVASNTLAQMGSPRAVHALLELVRGGDLRLRYLGLRGLARVRVRAGKPIVSRVLAHRLFLRELRDLRASLDAAAALGTHASPEVRLLADSYRESADWAIERAMQALALWYEPRPLIGVIDRLRSRDPLLAPPALEFLEHVLPREIFAPVRKIFEPAVAAAAGEVPSPAALAEWIGSAWDSEDGWLRACAVRASRLVPGFDPARFAARHDDDPRVREELLALERVTARNPSSSLREAAC